MARNGYREGIGVVGGKVEIDLINTLYPTLLCLTTSLSCLNGAVSVFVWSMIELRFAQATGVCLSHWVLCEHCHSAVGRRANL